MRLYLADTELAYAKLWHVGDIERAREHLQTATKLVEQMGYHSKDNELLVVKQMLTTRILFRDGSRRFAEPSSPRQGQ